MQYKGLEIGSRIKNLRIKKNVSVFEMAIRTNKSQSHIYRLEEGAVKMSIDMLYELMNVLETDANTLLGINRDNKSIDAELNKLDPEIRGKIVSLFETMIKQAEVSQTN